MTRVLVVDDMPENLRLVRKILTMAKFEVAEAKDSAGALAAAKASMPDVVLLDLRLGEGELTGFDLVQLIRKMPGGDQAAIVALSGGAVLEDEAASRAAGFDGFISKPFDVFGLPDLLRTYASRRSGPAAQ